MSNDFELLIRKDIIAILDGDELLGESNDSLFRMPYLKGTDLCLLSDTFGLHQDYGNVSRWTYLDNLLRFVVKKNRCDELLCYMFDLERFYQLERLSDPDSVEKIHTEICHAALKKINAKLALGRHELQYVGGHFFITETGKTVQVESPKIEQISVAYVRGLAERCKEDLLSGKYDSVITKSRTIIEEVLIYILEKNHEPVTAKGDIGKLYNQVKNKLNMQQRGEYDKRVNSLLSGLEKIVDAIASMRNLNSDAHGAGSNRIQIQEREARLAMNSAITFCEYLLSIGQ